MGIPIDSLSNRCQALVQCVLVAGLVAVSSGAMAQSSPTEVPVDLPDEAHIKASNVGGGDLFGNSVAVSGDTLVVGALHESSSARGVNGNQADNSLKSSGAAYVFVRESGTWVQQAYLKAHDPGLRRCFGASVAIEGDTIAVGAIYKPLPQSGARRPQCVGYVYVFERRGGAWTPTAALETDTVDIRPGGSYSARPRISGNTIVSARHIFVRNDSGKWVVQDILPEGSSIASLSGDTAVVSVTEYSPVVRNSQRAVVGRALKVFERVDGKWTERALLTKESSPFGPVVISGDVVVVGRPAESERSDGPKVGEESGSHGAVHIYSRHGQEWSRQALLTWPVSSFQEVGKGTSASFGSSVAVRENILVVGTSGVGANVACLYRLQEGTWRYAGHLRPRRRTALRDNLGGMSVAISGSTIVVGDVGDDSDASGVNGTPKEYAQRSMDAPRVKGYKKGDALPDNGAPTSGAAYVFQAPSL